jgi:hypothetical protein
LRQRLLKTLEIENVEDVACHHLIHVDVQQQPDLVRFLHSLAFDLDNPMNGTFLPMKEASQEAWEAATRHAGNHRGYRVAMEAYLKKEKEEFDRQVRALGPGNGVEWENA